MKRKALQERKAKKQVEDWEKMRLLMDWARRDGAEVNLHIKEKPGPLPDVGQGRSGGGEASKLPE